jgi:hypothetical protein
VRRRHTAGRRPAAGFKFGVLGGHGRLLHRDTHQKQLLLSCPSSSNRTSHPPAPAPDPDPTAAAAAAAAALAAAAPHAAATHPPAVAATPPHTAAAASAPHSAGWQPAALETAESDSDRPAAVAPHAFFLGSEEGGTLTLPPRGAFGRTGAALRRVGPGPWSSRARPVVGRCDRWVTGGGGGGVCAAGCACGGSRRRRGAWARSRARGGARADAASPRRVTPAIRVDSRTCASCAFRAAARARRRRDVHGAAGPAS